MSRPSGTRRTLSPGVLTVGLLLLVALVGAAFWVPRIFTGGVVGPQASPTAPAWAAPLPTKRQAEIAAEYAAAVRDGDTGGVSAEDLPGLTPSAQGVAYAALRAGGERLAEAWGTGSGPSDAIRDALGDARAALEADELGLVDAVELDVIGTLTPVDLNDPGGLTANDQRGIVGLQVELDGVTHRVAPTSMIASNTDFERVTELLAAENGVSPAAVQATPAQVMETSQYLIGLSSGTVVQMYRGNEVVPLESVTRESTQELADGLIEWLVANCGEDGRMVYEYFPSRGEESSQNNMIRQWMATIALETVAEATGDASLYEVARRNIEYNLELSYSTERRSSPKGELGLIADPDGEVKLGAVALAALAISMHPDQGDFVDQAGALRRTVDSLWHADGSFSTFYRPPGRNDNQNFYPGEALLLWAATLEHQAASEFGIDPELLDRFMRSFSHYREFHQADPNPAFIPWHSMAYEKVWRLTEDVRLDVFVTEMNDWLLDMQQWDEVAPDLAGRFYNPDEDYGPPHASSDGVYLEGLIAAYRVARDTNAPEQAERYRTAILRGLRNAQQLQFADDVDMFYISQRERVAGGMRTTAYDNRVRVDNVQHNLLAVLGILETFEDDDWVGP